MAQAKIHEALRQHPQRRFMRRIPGIARPYCRYRCRLRRQHQLVQIPLRRAEFSIHRKRARDVGRVAVQFAACIDQQQIAAFEPGIVFHIVQYAGVGAAGDD